MEYSRNEILKIANEINSKSDNFLQYCNSREYEELITDVAKSIIITEKVYNDLLDLVKTNLEENKNLSFTLYFILYTMCRRQSYGDLTALVEEHRGNYSEYYIIEHIRLMAVLDKSTNTSKLYRAIKDADKLIKKRDVLCDFENQVGVLNLYCALVCKYFEAELDERDEGANKELIQKALIRINNAIDIEEKSNKPQTYSKFFLNRGRIYILKGKYNKGEEDIQRAINLLQASEDRMSKVNEYSQYLMKASIIRSYDLNEEKVKDLDKIKVNNYKSIALMTTLLGFLLGAINIFTDVKDPFTLAMLMVCYAGLLLVLLGTILLGLTITLKERKATLFIYDVLLIIVGAAIFGVCIYFIISKGLIG